MRRVTTGLAVAALVVLLSGCIGRYAPAGFSQPVPDAESFEGTWVHERNDGDPARLSFSTDGTWVFSAVPAELFAGGPDITLEDAEASTDLRDGSGTWVVVDGAGAPWVMASSEGSDFALFTLGDLFGHLDTLYVAMQDPDLGSFYQFEGEVSPD